MKGAGWRKQNKEENRELYSSPNQIEDDEIGKVCSTNGGLEERV
jgi:hypothetical protein